MHYNGFDNFFFVVLVLLLLWVFRTAAALSESTSFWQLKEYRWDRMREFLIQQNGKHYFLTPFHVAYIFLALLFVVSWAFVPAMKAFLTQWLFPISGVLFLAECLKYGHQLLLRKLRRPRLTMKALLILAFSFFVEVCALALVWSLSPWLLPSHLLALVLLSLAALEHDINAFAVSFLNFFSRLAKRRIFRQAQAKRLLRKDLKVIGITGSFGKTSVKEYLSHILEGGFKVLKTEKNTNTEIGISQTILKKLKPVHEIFVCEMGAYTKGEIRTCAQIARPNIGIFTGLNNQHAALFGSLDDTFKSKWELIQALPADGLAVFNGDSEALRKRLLLSETRQFVCSVEEGDAVAQDIDIKTDSLQFSYKGQLFTASLVGNFQVVNLLMAIVVAEFLGMDLKHIADRVSSIAAPEKTMQISSFSRGMLIDDSYNVNADGLKQALLHLDRFKDFKKVLVFPGILELGEDSHSLHENYGEFIGQHVDYAFFTDPHFSSFLSDGALRSGLTRQDIFETEDQNALMDLINDLLSRHPTERFVFLFESRGAERTLEMLKDL